MKFIFQLAVVLLIVLGTSCTPERLKPRKFLAYVTNPKNEFVKTKELSSMSFSCYYKPPAYSALQELNSAKTNWSSEQFDKKKKDYSEFYTFTFRLKSNENLHPLEQGNQEQNDYFRKLQHYINAQGDFQLLLSTGDTLPCALYHMERNYGAAPYIDLNVAFKRSKKAEGMTFMFYDRVWRNGLVMFRYSNEHLAGIPKVNL